MRIKKKPLQVSIRKIVDAELVELFIDEDDQYKLQDKVLVMLILSYKP